MRSGREYLFLGVLMFCHYLGIIGQIILDNPPKKNAFIARNVLNNMGTISLKGLVTNPAYSTLEINIYKDRVLIKSDKYAINVLLNQASFNQKTDLTAGKYIYAIELKLQGSGNSYIRTIEGIMVGDVYLIQGQSNAVAANYYNLSINYSKNYTDTFIKSFGNSNYDYNAAQSDTTWYVADGENYYNKGCVGQWGLVMAKVLLDSFGIPICLINGAVGGTPITAHTSTSGNSEDIYSIYGRLLYRAKKAGVQNQIRGIFYFQGESDGSNARLHDSLFRKVYNSWNKDYKDFKKLYIVQVRGKGCGYPSIELREYQRRFEFALSKCKVISTNGLNNHDGCHYGFSNGYELLGKQLAALVSRDLYKGKILSNIDPPNIRNCYYSHAMQDEITVKMYNSSDIIYTDPLFYKIFRIEGDNSVSITGGFIRNNCIVLKLNKSSCLITGLSYDSDIGNQPWVKNGMQMGLLSCHNVAIARHQVQSSYSGCKKAFIFLGEDSIAACLYLWKRPGSNKVYTTSKIKILGDSAEKLSLIITYATKACKNKDTIPVYMLPDPVIIPELGNDRNLCAGDSVKFQPNTSGYKLFQWKNGPGISSYDFICKVFKQGKVVLIALSNTNCLYGDSMFMNVSNPIVSLPVKLRICRNSDTLITVPDSFITYRWNHISGNHKFRAGPGMLVLETRDKNNCYALDSTEIILFPDTPIPGLTLKICGNENMKVSRPIGFYTWYHNEGELSDSFLVYPDSLYPILLLDSNLCFVKDSLRTEGLSIPEFSLGKDSGFCINEQLEIQLPTNMDEYFWNNTRLMSNSVKVNSSGIFSASVTNSEGCHYYDTIIVNEYNLPDLSIYRDTVICTGEKWYPIFDYNVAYKINSVPIKNDFYFDKAGFYNIHAINQYQCQSQKDIEIIIKNCNSSLIKNIDTKTFLYPNPFISSLYITSNTLSEIPATIFNCEGKEVFSFTVDEGLNSLDLSFLKEGLYQIRIAGQYFLLIKQ